MNWIKAFARRWQKNTTSFNATQFDVLLNDLVQLRAKSSHLVLYGSPTGSDWKGIANMSKLLFPENSLELPQIFSKSVLSEEQTHVLQKKITELKFEKLSFSGFAPYFFEWIESFAGKMDVACIYHGTISEFHSPDIRNFIQKLVNLYRTKKIQEIGFIHKDLIPFFAKIYSIPAQHFQPNKPQTVGNSTKLNLDKEKIHIGVFGTDNFNKNLHNQVIHALMIENTVVHVLNKENFHYLDQGDRIVDHGSNLTHEEFLNILGSMDINLYLSFNESFGLIKFESENLGVPCIKLDETDYLSKIADSIENRNGNKDK